MLITYSGVVNYEDIKSYTSDTTGEKFELKITLVLDLELMTQVQ